MDARQNDCLNEDENCSEATRAAPVSSFQDLKAAVNLAEQLKKSLENAHPDVIKLVKKLLF